MRKLVILSFTAAATFTAFFAASPLASIRPAAADTPATAAPTTSAPAAAAAPAPGKPVPKDRKARPGDYALMTAEAMNSGTIAIHASLGAPFVDFGVAIGIARRLNVGIGIRSAYTLRNAPEFHLKLHLFGNKRCADTALGTYCYVIHALALQVTGGYMLGGTIDRDVTLADGTSSYRLAGLPGYIDDANHLRITPALVYSYVGAGIPAFVRAQVLIQKYTEEADPSGTPRDLAFFPELVGGMELVVGTRIHFYLEGGAGAYIDPKHPVEGDPTTTERRVTVAGHVEAGLVLFVY